jgi:hypothetical protein
VTERIMMGRWDCHDCLKAGNLGTSLDCEDCGKPFRPGVDPDEAYYLPPGAEEIIDPEVLQLANLGPNWFCTACGSANRANVSECRICSDPARNDDHVLTKVVYGDEALLRREGAERSCRHCGKAWIDRQPLGVDDPLGPDAENCTCVCHSGQRSNADKAYDPLRHHEEVLEKGTKPMAPGATEYRAQHEVPRDGGIAQRMRGYDQDIARRRAREALGLPRYVWDNQRQRVYLGAGGVALTLLFFLIYSQFFATKTIDLEVDALTWDRAVELQVFRTVKESDWSTPSDARDVRAYQAVHHYERVFSHMATRYRTETYQSGTRTETYTCGTTSNANGTFTSQTCTRSVPVYSTRQVPYQEAVYRDEPVYRTKYDYEVDRWKHNGWERETGDHVIPPFWPERERYMNVPDRPELGTIRHGPGRQESYKVKLVDMEGRSFFQDVDFATWDARMIGELKTGNINARGHLRSVNWVSQQS